MALSVRAVATSWLFAFAAGLALWPPRLVYWEAVAAVAGDGVTVVVVGVVATALGAGFARATGVELSAFTLGAIAAYGSGMLGIRVALTPDSPVHLVLYGGLLACFVGGAVLSRLGAGPTGRR